MNNLDMIHQSDWEKERFVHTESLNQFKSVLFYGKGDSVKLPLNSVFKQIIHIAQ